jgi:D-arabinose 1-dehydrogenase-like Zn-dependent alcohol dehydrogenase
VPHGRYLLPHDGVPQSLAATYTCSGITAFSALKKTRGHLGVDDHLVIIGAGGVGGSAVHIAPAAVAGKVIVADLDAQKRAQARQMGAVATIDNSAPDAVKQVMEATEGGAAAAIDFVGSPKTMGFGVNILRKGGKLVMVGLYNSVTGGFVNFMRSPAAGCCELSMGSGCLIRNCNTDLSMPPSFEAS